MRKSYQFNEKEREAFFPKALKTQKENDQKFDSDSPFSKFFPEITKKEEIILMNISRFVAIKMPTKTYIYEWFPKTTKFSVLRNFVLAMDRDNILKDKKFVFADAFNDSLEFNDEDYIDLVQAKAKEFESTKQQKVKIQEKRIIGSQRGSPRGKVPPSSNTSSLTNVNITNENDQADLNLFPYKVFVKVVIKK